MSLVNGRFLSLQWDFLGRIARGIQVLSGTDLLRRHAPAVKTLSVVGRLMGMMQGRCHDVRCFRVQGWFSRLPKGFLGIT